MFYDIKLHISLNRHLELVTLISKRRNCQTSPFFVFFYFDVCSLFFVATDKPDPAGNGGSSNTANVAKEFFSFKNREAAKNLLEVSF